MPRPSKLTPKDLLDIKHRFDVHEESLKNIAKDYDYEYTAFIHALRKTHGAKVEKYLVLKK